MFRQSLNQKQFTYKNYVGTTPVISEDTGLPNGEYAATYTGDITAWGNISAPTGRMVTDVFGWNDKFDLVIVPSDNLLSIGEGSIVYIDGIEYDVVRVGRTLNETVVAVARRAQ